MNDDEFCPDCAVSIDLHDGDDSCALAARKARLLDMFHSAIFGVSS